MICVTHPPHSEGPALRSGPMEKGREMTEATLRPWRALPTTPVVDSASGNVIVCRCGGGYYHDKISMDRWMADAALIVRAVNAHDALVEALTKCAGQFRACLIDDGTDPEYADIAVAKYLALARGDAP